MKRVIGLLLVCALALAMASFALAQGEEFEIDAEKGIITAYSGTAETVRVPSEVGGVPVRAIGGTAFSQNTAIREVILPEGLTHILGNAFYFCENLEKVAFPSSLQSIDGYAFFANKKLTAIRLPASLSHLGERAFASCESLQEVQLLGSLVKADSTAFEFGPGNRQFTVPQAAMDAYQAVLPGPFAPGPEEQAIFGTPAFEIDGQGMITAYSGFDAYLQIPESVDGSQVKGIAKRAFYTEAWLRVLELPEGLTSIGEEAFFGTKLAQVRFPDSLQEIGEEAFSGAPLMVLQLPDKLQSLGKSAFSNARFKELHLPGGLETVPERAFASNWQLETLYIPANIRKIESQAFLDNDRMNFLVFLAAEAPEMAEDAFLECDAIADIDIAHGASRAQALAFEAAFAKSGTAGTFKVWRAYHPQAPAFPGNLAAEFDEATQMIRAYSDTLDKVSMYFNYWKKDGSGTLDVLGVGEGAFEGSNIKEFYPPRSDAFTTIAARAFKDSSLEFIDLFDSITEIGEEAFMGCANLKGLAIPDSVQVIGANAFLGCDSLEELVLPAAVRLSGSLGLPAEKIRVAAEATDEQVAALQAALGLSWEEKLLREGEQTARVLMPEGMAFSPESDFEFEPETGTIRRYTGQQEEVAVPRAIQGVPVTAIGFSAFSDLTVLSVAQGTQDNLSLKTVILPDTVRNIEDSAFLNCAALTKVEAYGPIDRLGIRAFENCAALREVHFYNGIREIGIYAFNLCASLKQVGFGPSNPDIPEGAFAGCGFEGSLAVSATSIGNLAYQNNAGLTSLHILPSVQSIGEAAFAGATGLLEVYFEGANPDILGSYRYPFDPAATGMKVYLPENSTDGQVAAFISQMNQNSLPGESMVSRKDCPENHDGAVSQAPAQPKPEAAPAENPQAPDQGFPAGKFVCVKATSNGIEVDLAMIGEYAVEFLADQTAVLTVAGTAFPPMPVTLHEGGLTLDYVGQQYQFKALAEGGYELDFMGAMLLTFQQE